MSQFTVRDFNFMEAFVFPNKKCSELTSRQDETYIENVILSRVMAYMYAALKYPKAKLEVEKQYKSIMSKLFPDRIVNIGHGDSTEETTIQVTILQVSSKIRKEGDLMMPMFLKDTTDTIYNIHMSEANNLKSSPDYVIAVGNYFHKVIRSISSGDSRVLWKDPISRDTKLREESYENTFLIYLCDKYLRHSWDMYPFNLPDKSLAACVELSTYLKTITSKVKILTIREGLEIVPSMFLPNNCKDVSRHTDNIIHDADKSNLFDTAYFIGICGMKDKTFTLIISTYGTKSYSYLADVLRIFPYVSIQIWDKNAPDVSDDRITVFKKSITKRDINEEITAKGRNETTLIIMTGISYSSVDNAFNSINYKGRLLLTVGNTTIDPALDSELSALCFMSPFTPLNAPRARIIVAGGLDHSKRLSQEAKDLIDTNITEGGTLLAKLDRRKIDVKNYSNWLINNYRDAKLWQYSYNDKKLSYDETLLSLVTE